jgi:hypothetical protein
MKNCTIRMMVVSISGAISNQNG